MFRVCLFCLFERLVHVLHLGPPCSFFSMAVNRFKTAAMRSAYQPKGVDDLPPHKEEKVRLGNAFAEISVWLTEADDEACNFWVQNNLLFPLCDCLLQLRPLAPSVPLLWLSSTYACLKPRGASLHGWLRIALASNGDSVGAPAVTTIYRCRESLHVASVGRCFASPYWPEFAREWV